MPAEGAMETRLEAPAQEPRNVLGPDGEIRLAGVSRAFGRRNAAPVPALADVSLEVAAGETVAVVGPSGCGKTTLLELVCGLQEPDSGSVRAARRRGEPRRGARPRASAVRRLRPGGLRARAARRAVGRDAPARRLPAHAAVGQA